MKSAINLALLLNELITNSLKHAFDHNGGIIVIKLKEREKDIKFEYVDDGKGFDTKFIEKSVDNDYNNGGSERSKPAGCNIFLVFPAQIHAKEVNRWKKYRLAG